MRTRPPGLAGLVAAGHALARGLDALFPRVCAGCGAGTGSERGSARGSERVLCPACDARLPRIPDPACAVCQERPGRLLHPGAAAIARCSACAGPDVLDAAVAAVWLEDEVARWIRSCKYPEPGLHRLDPRPVAALGELAVRAARRVPGPAPDWVVPVPLHPRRLRARGFNPAGLAARAVARALGVPLAPTALVRLRDTPSQTGLTAPARRRNLRDALAAVRPAPARVWIVDDVLTTGATAREAARALRAAGATGVVAVAAARTPRSGVG